MAGNLKDHLLKGTAIYFVGTFLSKAMTVLILPLITAVLSTEDYGYYDFVITVTMVIMPIFTLQSVEAVFRFLFDADMEKRKELLSTVWIIVGLGTILCGLAMYLCNQFIYKIPYCFWLYIYYLATVILQMYQRVARSLGKSKQFAISGVINTFVLVIVQAIALLCLGLGIDGLILGYVVATVITCIYLEYHTKSVQQFSHRHVNAKCLRKVIEFGLPLVPNNISWWAVSIINKSLIIAVFGLGANGIFAITNRFTALFTTLTEVFRLSWQESAIVAYKDEEKRTNFYSAVFNSYLFLLIVGCCVILHILKIIFPILVEFKYQSAWLYLPPVMFGAVFSAVVAFYGAGYSASAKTRDALRTTIFGVILNILVCYLLIKSMGLFAPALGTIAAYLLMWLLRQHSMKNYFKINIQFKKLMLLIPLCIGTIFVYYQSGYLWNAIFGIVLCICIGVSQFKLIKSCVAKVSNMYRAKTQ